MLESARGRALRRGRQLGWRSLVGETFGRWLSRPALHEAEDGSVQWPAQAPAQSAGQDSAERSGDDGGAPSPEQDARSPDASEANGAGPAPGPADGPHVGHGPDGGEPWLHVLARRIAKADARPEALIEATEALLRDEAADRSTLLVEAEAAGRDASGGVAAALAWLQAVAQAEREPDGLKRLFSSLREGGFALALGRWFGGGDDPAKALPWLDRVSATSAIGEARLLRGEILRRSGNWRLAMASFAAAQVNEHPLAFSSASALADEAAGAAAASPDADDWLLAGELFAFVHRVWPEQVPAAVEAARWFRKAGEPERIAAMLRLVEDPDLWQEATLAVAEMLLTVNDFDGAVDLLDKAGREGSEPAKRRYYDIVRGEGGAPPPSVRPRSTHAGRFPVLDTGISSRELLNRLTAEASRRQLIGTLDHSSHRAVTEEGIDARHRVRFDQVGWLTINHQGRVEPLLMGVVAVRGRILSDRRLGRVTLTLQAAAVASGEPSLVRHNRDKFLYAFNLWLDADRIGACRGDLCLWAEDVAGELLTAAVTVNVTRAPASLELDDSDSFIRSPDEWGDVTADILARPALVRSGLRTPIPDDVAEVLVMRVDQLGDLSATLPAIARTRELFPRARITGLVSPGLREILHATGLCDEVLELTLIYDPVSERRYLGEAEQARVTAALDRHDFDIAIDFCPADETRTLLKLVDARFLVGFNPREFKYLDLGVDLFTRDKVNQAGIISHSAYVSVLVEALAVVMRQTQGVVPRRRDDEALLAGYGLVPQGYIVIHSGARHPINCWPLESFVELAVRLAGFFGLKIVFFADDNRSPGLPDDGRFIVAGKMPVDTFDALLTNSALMIGNDSGPKHLAAVRGARTVSIHTNRLNWREWGQEGNGLIIAKRVPCCGCGLNNLAMCAKDAACITTIPVEQVFDAIVRYMEPASPDLELVAA